MFTRFVMVAALMLLGVASAQADGHGAHTTVTATGSFEGRSDHVVTGGLTILKTETGYVAVLESNFSLDDAPAPTLGFGNDGDFVGATEFSKLESKTGLQVYAIPAGIDPSAYGEFYVWCSRFDVPLGVAALAR